MKKLTDAITPLIKKTEMVLSVAVLSGVILFISNSNVYSIPSYARQTGLACSSCHYNFPQLTPFGRLFKLNGYTMVGAPTLVSAHDEEKNMEILSNFPLSAMVMTSYSKVSKATPGTEAGSTQFPQQLSLFLAGELAPKIGSYIQLTYDPTSGTIGMDMADFRYADHTLVGGKDFLYGITLNNNPTMQDVWNTTPAWGFPYIASSSAPSPSWTPILDNAMAGNVLGLGIYGLYDNLVYAEISAYHSAIQGVPYPADSAWVNNIKGVAPYWRVALQHDWGKQYLEVGTFGFASNLFPAGISGPYNKYTDIGFDAQYEKLLGSGELIAHASYITEKQNLDATFAAGGSSSNNLTLNTFKVDANYNFPSMFALALGYMATTGTTDAVFYSPAAVSGSATGSPNSSAITAQVSFIPWLNTQIILQYVAYTKFNGASTNYDGSGRNASDNNTLYLATWFAF
ncbi:MAG: cytochrome C [Candidatus Kryptoniota bacterium]